MRGRKRSVTRWDELRVKLGLGDYSTWLGKVKPYDREWTAQQLGLGVRTIERYELHDEAPDWYGMALVGLAVKLEKLKVERVKQKA